MKQIAIAILALLLGSAFLYADDDADQQLLKAVRSRNVRLVQKILDENPYANANYVGADGLTLIMIAIKGRNLQVVKTILAAGGTVDDVDRNGRSALSYAVDIGDKAMIDLLVTEYGANMNLQDYNDETPLMFAVKQSSTNAVKALLEYKPNLELKNVRGQTALMLAASNGNADIVRLLLEAGANRDVRDSSGKKAIDMTHNSQIIGLLENYGKDS